MKRVIGLLIVALAITLTAVSAASAGDNKKCGSFRMEGLRTEVRVKVVRGNVDCHTANRVMHALFKHGRERGDWECVGPQTGYAACERGRNKVTGRF